jgi:hypothetical protein
MGTAISDGVSLRMMRFFRLQTVLFFVASALALSLPAGGFAAPGSKTVTIAQEHLQQAIGQRFPYQQKLADVLDLKILSPRLALLPEANRIGTELDLNLLERIGGRTYTGTMALDYGLRFERADNSVRMTGVRVSRVRLNDVPEPFNGAISRHMPRMAEQLLNNYALHTLSEQDMMLVSGLGFEPGEIKVTPKGLRVTLDPMTSK